MNRWVERWQRLSRRGRMALMALGLVCLAFWSYQALYRPQAVKVKKVQGESLALRQQLERMKAELPDLELERQQQAQQTKAIEQLQKELEDLESRLPGASELDQLLEEVTRREKGLQVAFESIRQQLNEESEPPVVSFGVGFKTTYEGLVSYLRRLEHLSPFLRITQLEVTQAKAEAKEAEVEAEEKEEAEKEEAEVTEGPGGLVETHLTLATPLRTSAEGGRALALRQAQGERPEQSRRTLATERRAAEKVSLPRSPFFSRRQLISKTKPGALKLSGITGHGAAGTAIINDEVVRVGGEVDHLRVTQILPDRVTLSDGVESYTLMLESDDEISR